MLAQIATRYGRRDPVQGPEHPPSMPHQNRIGSRKDQEEMQVDHRHEDREQREQVDQARLGDDLGPVITPHERADRDDADAKNNFAESSFGPLPEDPRPDGEDQQLLKNQTHDR